MSSSEARTAREEWRSQFGFLMALLGAMVGAGNIWRMPFATEQNSGGAYLVALFAILALPGVANAVLVRSLRTEGQKLELLQEQGSVDSYSPRALQKLREWIQAHPNDPYASDARQQYNECVRTLREIKEPYYDWSAEQIEELETI